MDYEQSFPRLVLPTAVWHWLATAYHRHFTVALLRASSTS